MATLKSIPRSATVAFAPMASIMAVGTMAGAIDPSFSSSASLEILEINFSNTGQELPVINSCPTSERFNRLSWGNNVVGSEEYALGIIAGGLLDGSINLWNPAKLASGDGADPVDSVIARLEKHSGAVRGLEFSVLAPNLLASGGDDGDLYIWDLKFPTAPSHYPKLRAGGAQGEISYLSWNRKVQPILAATSSSGASVVWDLRKARPVLSFTDPNSRRRCSSLQWNPENATQLIVASDDDRLPSLQVWDLRNSVSPLKEFVGHSKGVLAMAWCPIDSSILLTCGKDNLTLCWDTSSGEILCEVPASNNWNFDVQWSPRTPGVLSTSSFDGNVSLYNIEACSGTPSSETSFGREIAGIDSSYVRRKAPKWLKRPVGVSFGFGGKLITFGPSKKAASAALAPTLSEIHLHSLVTEEELVKKSMEFESAIAGGEKPVLRAFCDSKAETVETAEDKETWRFLKVMFEDDARRKLLTHLSFDVPPTESGDLQEPEEKIDGSAEARDANNESLETEAEPALAPLDNTPKLDEAGEEDFFDNIQTPKTPDADVAISRLEDLTMEKSTGDGDAISEPVLEDEEVDESEAVQRALVVGDFKAAVQQCLATNRTADALILAYVGGSTLWETTQNEYIKRTGRSYLKILSAVVNNDLRRLVETRPLKAWKETLALLCTYARSEDWTLLSDALAARLDAANETQAATLCYICSGNIEKAAEIWSRSLDSVSGGRGYVEALQALMEKVVVLSLGTGQKRLSTSLARLVKWYAELLVSQGLLGTAQEYLSLVPADQSSLELAVLQDRIYGSGVPDVQAEPPSVPWESQPLQVQAPAAPLESSQRTYPPTDNTPTYYQPPFVPTPLSLPADHHATPVDASRRIYPLPENSPSSYYPRSNDVQYFTPSVPSQNYIPAQPVRAPPPVQTFVPASPRQQPISALGTVGPVQGQAPQVPSNAWYDQRTNDVRTFMPGVTSQTFMPGVPSQTFTPVPPVPVSTIAFMPASPRQQSLSASGPVPPHVQSPQLTSTPAPITPSPPPTIQTVDTSNVSAELKPVVATLTRLFNETSEAVGGSRAIPVRRREIENNSRKLGALFLKLNTADLSGNASSKLIQLCQALDIGDYVTALQIQVGLTTSDWDECSVWLAALKQMIKTRQAMR